MKLKLLVEQKKEKKVHDFQAAECVIMGRNGPDLVLEDARCSRQHALLFETAQGELSLRDLGSSNGTEVNGEKIRTVVIRTGESFTVGDTQITILDFQSALGKPAVAASATTATSTSAAAPSKEPSPDTDPDVLIGWPASYRSLEKEKLRDFIDHIDEKGKLHSVRLADLIKEREAKKK